MTEAWIIDACRTPRGIGKVGKGALAALHPQVLGATVLRALAERNGLDTGDVDDIVWGTSMQVGTQGGDLGRMAALDAGYAITASGVTLDRFCGSGISSVNFAAASVMSGMEDVVIAGGTEMMSSYAGNVSKSRSPFLDSGNDHLRAIHPQTNQGVAADAIATLEKIDRRAVDELAAESQRRAEIAIKEGRFDKSTVPVHDPDGTVLPWTGRSTRARERRSTRWPRCLRPSRHWPTSRSTRTARPTARSSCRSSPASRSPTCTTRATLRESSTAPPRLLMTSPEYANAHGMRPRARIVATANLGDDPTLMLNAPVPATRKVLARAGMSLSDIDLFEVNEAFAVVPEKFIRDLDIDRERINVNGGAIALGHPIGATGSLLVGTALDELERRDQQVALITMCAGGGMAPAVIIERVS